MADDLIMYTDTDNRSYTELKQLAIDALTITSQSFTWNYTVAQNDMITAAQMNEIINAVDKAYDATNTGCSSNDSGYNSSNLNYESGYYSANSSDLTSNNSTNDTVCSSNLSAKHSTNYLTVT